MSVYSRFSKSIGWKGPELDLPTLDYANKLLDDVNAGDQNAFYTAFRFQRFGKTAEDDAQREVAQIPHTAYLNGQAKWYNTP